MHGLKPDVTVLLFINVDGNATQVGTSTLRGRASDATDTLQHHEHNHSLAHDSGLTPLPFAQLSWWGRMSVTSTHTTFT